MIRKLACTAAAVLFGLNVFVLVTPQGVAYAEEATEYKTCGCNGGTGPGARICVDWLYDECDSVDDCKNDCDPYDPE